MNKLLGLMAISWIIAILGFGVSHAGYVIFGKFLAIVSVITFIACSFIYVYLFFSRK